MALPATWTDPDSEEQATNAVVPSARLNAMLGDIKLLGDSCRLCQGRLTLATSTPITTTDQTAKTIFYFTPHLGDYIGLYNGGEWQPYQFAELSLAVPNAADTAYDIYIYDNGGTLTLEAVAWANVTTPPTRATQDGVLCKNGATTRRLVGSICTTAVAGQTEDSTSRRLVSNLYNRVFKPLVAVDTTNTWTYTTATLRPANNNTTDGVGRVAVMSCEAAVRVRARACNECYNNSEACAAATGIGLDATNANSAQVFAVHLSTGANQYSTGRAEYEGYPGVGYHYLQRLENAGTATGTQTWSGDNGGALRLTGMIGEVEC